MNAKKIFLYTALLFLLANILCFCFNWYGSKKLNQPVIFDIRGRNHDAYRSIMLRNNDYDALIAGSSMSVNFRCSEFDDAFKTHSIKIAKTGANIIGMSIVMEYALSLRPTKYVLLDMTTSLENDPQEIDIEQEFYSGKQNLSTIAQYLTFDTTMRTLRFFTTAHNVISRDEYNIWYKKYRNKDLLGELSYNVQEHFRETDGTLPHPDEEMNNTRINLQNRLLPLIKRHPDTTFLLFLPPYTFFAFDPNHLDREIAYRRLIMQTLLSCPNVRFYDFQMAQEITSNFKNYKDPTHYMEHINPWIIQQIAQDKYRVTADGMEAYLKRLQNCLQQHDYEADKMALFSQRPPTGKLKD